jgi:predicted NACHT family NTPase
MEQWLATGPNSVILGRAGSGKSTLLRFLIIDLLTEAPSLARLAETWDDHLPVWVPFARWTHLISTHDQFSLKQLLEDWLKDYGVDEIWPLIEQAIDDERLLLLVDGLDEWADESSGRRALQLLQVFIRQRNLPAIVTSRPHGYTRLGMQASGWQVGVLDDLSQDQQYELVHLWFSVWLEQSVSSADDAGVDVVILTDRRVNGFMAELRQSADLQELARNPLLLSLLISLRILDVIDLPQNRFKAYRELSSPDYSSWQAAELVLSAV